MVGKSLKIDKSSFVSSDEIGKVLYEYKSLNTKDKFTFYPYPAQSHSRPFLLNIQGEVPVRGNMGWEI